MPAKKGYGGMGRKSMGMKKGGSMKYMPSKESVNKSMTMKGKVVMGNKASFTANPSIGGNKM